MKLLEGIVREEDFLKEGLRKKKLWSEYCSFRNHVYGYFCKCVDRKVYQVVGSWQNAEVTESIRYV